MRPIFCGKQYLLFCGARGELFMELYNPGHLGVVEGGEAKKVLIVKAGANDLLSGEFDEVVEIEPPAREAEEAALKETTWGE